MILTANGIAYEVGDRIQANLTVAFRYQCKSGTITEIGPRGYLVKFDDTELSPLWLKPEHWS